jgi:23S rRNA (cytosine1962-C5)-methyltransferase
MSASNCGYELLDFGGGRKLERFGALVLDRPSPAAEGAPQYGRELWERAAARFQGTRTGDGLWNPDPPMWAPREWYFTHEGQSQLQLRLDALPSGQVGVFPEQRESWEWIARQAARRSALSSRPKGGLASMHTPPLRVLNLFAYTGGSTLAAAAAGAQVVHVDAARSIVERARENAALSNLADRPLRWIAEDAMKFCQRELRRGNRYDAVILDPPSYGHGPKGEPWKFDKHLLPLLALCGELTAESRKFVLVTCHTPGVGPAELAAYLAEGIFGHCGQPPASGELYLAASDGRRLPSGVFARWPP